MLNFQRVPSGHQMWKIHDWWMIFHGNDSQRLISWPFITMNHYWPPIYYPLSTNILSIINQYTIHYQPIYYPLSTNILSIINQYTIHYQPLSTILNQRIPTVLMAAEGNDPNDPIHHHRQHGHQSGVLHLQANDVPRWNLLFLVTKKM